MSLETIQKELWAKAINFFAENPSEQKLRRKNAEQPLPYSFIQVDGEIYAMDREYLGQGGFSKVKKVINQYGEIFKVNISGKENLADDHKEELVTKKISEFIGKTKIISENPKEFWKHLQNHPDPNMRKSLITQQKTYKIMKYHKGVELWDALYNVDFTDIELIVIAIQCAKAVQAAHKAGFIHADIKAQNFIIDLKDFSVKLIDYGFSKFLPTGKNFVQDSAQGTLEFVAPEIFNQDAPELSECKYSFASDIYALGILFANYLNIDFDHMTKINPAERPPIEDVITLLKIMAKMESDYTETLKAAVESKIPPMELYCDRSHIKTNSKSVPNLLETKKKLNLNQVGLSPRSQCSPVARTLSRTPSPLAMPSSFSSIDIPSPRSSSPCSSSSSSSPIHSPRSKHRQMELCFTRSSSPLTIAMSTTPHVSRTPSPHPAPMDPTQPSSSSTASPRGGRIIFNRDIQDELEAKLKSCKRS